MCRVPSSTHLTCTHSDVVDSTMIDATAARLTILEGTLLDVRSQLTLTEVHDHASLQ
jgi:hypothetical protein